MLESIIVALITSGVSLIGIVITVVAENRKTTSKMEVNQAVTDTKIEELTREVRNHNNFAIRMPVVEEQIKNLDTRLSVIESSTVIRKV